MDTVIDSEDDGGISPVILAGTIGGVLLIVVIVIVVYMLLRKRRVRSAETLQGSTRQSDDGEQSSTLTREVSSKEIGQRLKMTESQRILNQRLAQKQPLD